MHYITGVDVSVDYETLQVKVSPKVGGQYHHTGGRILFLFHHDDYTYVGVTKMILISQKGRTAAINPVDAAGNTAAVQNVVWESSDESIVSVVAAEDGLSAVFTSVGPVGSVQLTVTADADMGEGVKTISGTLDVQVVSGEAVALQINVLPEEPVV